MALNSTIFALSTPVGRSGLCIFRISGPQSLNIVKSLCKVDLSTSPRLMKNIKIEWKRRILDTGLACFFKGPYSSTGEDVVEFNLHGSLAIIDAMKSALNSFSSLSVREASRGEFTKRALLNGKIGLTAAEALGDILEAETELQLQLYQNNFYGLIDRKAEKWQNHLLGAISALEAEIEFGDTDNVGVYLEKYNFHDTITEIRAVLKDSQIYERMRTGFKVLILGPPNSGKSSLLNHLAKSDVSIVSEIAGTTRDLVSYDAILDGIPLKIVDSAGIRDSECNIERMGVEMAKKAAAESDAVIILLSDSEADFLHLNRGILNPDKSIVVTGKCDLLSNPRSPEKLYISSITGEGMDRLKDELSKILTKSTGPSSFLTKAILNQRQSECLAACASSIESFLKSKDLIDCSEHAKLALKAIRRIRGHSFNPEEVLDRIFANFCIGK